MRSKYKLLINVILILRFLIYFIDIYKVSLDLFYKVKFLMVGSFGIIKYLCI